MISVKKDQKESYIYLMGIEPECEFRLEQGIRILPAGPNPLPDDMIDSIMKHGSQSEIDLGMLIAALRLTSAQLIMDGVKGEELAIKTWNAQTALFILSSIINCEIEWAIQSDCSIEHFDSHSYINIITPGRLIIPSEKRKISIEECKQLETSVGNAVKLSEENKNLNLAMNALWSYRWNPNPSVQLAVIWSGIESLLSLDCGETTFRSGLLCSLFLGLNFKEYEDVKKLYNERSRAVHSRQVKKRQSVIDSAELLHRLIIKCLEIGSVPNEKWLLGEVLDVNTTNRMYT